MTFRRGLSITAGLGVMVIVFYELISPFAALLLSMTAIPALFVLHRCKGGDAFLAITLVIMWLILSHLFIIDSRDRALLHMEGEKVSLHGRILDMEARKKTGEERRLVLEMEAEAAGDARLPRKEKVLLNCEYREDLVPGDRIEAYGKLKLPDGRRNPNCFDYSLYLRSKGIYSSMYVEKLDLQGDHSSSLAAGMYRMKQAFLDQMALHSGEETADIMKAIMFGDKGCLDEKVEEDFRKNGTAHILAVSGLHIGMIYGFLTMLWKGFSTLLPAAASVSRGWSFFLFVMIPLGAYSFMAGFSPSVIRALLMIALHMFAKMTGRYYDLKCAALAVGIAAFLKNPLILFQSAFQMSFLAVFSLALVLPYMKRILTGSLLAGASIQAGLMPYLVYQFNWLPLFSVFINVPVVFLAGLIVPLGVMSLGLQGIGVLSPAAFLMDRINGVLCELLLKLNELCCIEGVTVFRLPGPHAGFIIAFYLGLLAFASETGRRWILRNGKRYITAATVAIITVSIAAGGLLDDGFRNKDLVFVDVGQGDCMHLRVKKELRLPGGITVGLGTRNYLFDGGGSEDFDLGKKTLRPYLLKNGVRTVDGAFVTHLHTDHYRGICSLAKEGMIKKLYLYEGNRIREGEICRETGLAPRDLEYLAKGDKIRLSHKASITILWPERRTYREYGKLLEDEKEENAISLIMRLDVDGISLLITGDMGEEGEIDLMRQGKALLDVDILKVGHHGSKYSSCDSFLDAVSPRIAVIQVGKDNTYGHPTAEVLTRLGLRGIPVYRNDLQGAVGFSIHDGKGKLTTMLK